MMKQYFDLKAKHPDAVMLFRCGDFYETYSEDAVTASEILGITLTKRANGQGKTVEISGFRTMRSIRTAETDSRPTCSYLASAGHPENNKAGKKRYHRTGHSGCCHQR